MADDTNPFGQVAPQGPNILDQWGQALQDPGFRASLMSFGAQLMQPMGFGQTPGGHLARAVGAGGEAATALEEQDLKERLTEAKLAQSEEATQIARGRLEVGQQNALTRRAALAQRGQGGGVSATTLFRNQSSLGRQMQTDAQKEARNILKQVQDYELINGRPPPGMEGYKGKKESDIAAELLADPKWTGNWQRGRGAATAANVPPREQRQVGQVYQTPKGPLEWQGKPGAEWILPTKKIGAGATMTAPEDEDDD